MPKLFFIVTIFVTGCSTYSSSLRPVQDGVFFGQTKEALTILDHIDPVKSTSQIEKSGGLLKLERAVLEQALGDYQSSANHFTEGDNALEYFDIEAYNRIDIAKWLFSDDSYTYRAPAYERILVSVMNMINFIALRDLENARVEARRFQKSIDFFINREEEKIQFDIVATGHYMAGYIYEMSYEFEDAFRQYSAAMRLLEGKASKPFVQTSTCNELESKITEMMRLSGRRQPIAQTPRLLAAANQANHLGPLTRQEYQAIHQGVDTLVVVQTGMVPYKQANYLPIGAAITLALAAPTRFQPPGDQLHQANLAMARGLLTTVNVPTLIDGDVPYNPNFNLKVSGMTPTPLLNVDVTAQVYAFWQTIQPIVIGSAITRALARLGLSEGTNQIAKVSGADGGFGQLAAALVQGAMTASDTPDTRSWFLLPSNIYLYRFEVTKQASIDFEISQGEEKTTIVAQNQRYQIINFSKFRQ